MASPSDAVSARPFPPGDLADPLAETGGNRFEPDPAFALWIAETFIMEGAPLLNEDHAHLREASFGVLWTNTVNSRGGRQIVGQCELGAGGGPMGKWAKARAAQQLREWFGELPDFLLTFDAVYAAGCDDPTFCALVEHELYHAGQERDEYGAPKFRKGGLPAFAIRGHDVEEFVGVVRRYGAKASGVEEMVRAANERPAVASAMISHACGTCSSRAA